MPGTVQSTLYTLSSIMKTVGSDSSPYFLDAMPKTTQENRAKFHFSDAKARFFSLSYDFPLWMDGNWTFAHHNGTSF